MSCFFLGGLGFQVRFGRGLVPVLVRCGFGWGIQGDEKCPTNCVSMEINSIRATCLPAPVVVRNHHPPFWNRLETGQEPEV